MRNSKSSKEYPSKEHSLEDVEDFLLTLHDLKQKFADLGQAGEIEHSDITSLTRRFEHTAIDFFGTQSHQAESYKGWKAYYMFAYNGSISDEEFKDETQRAYREGAKKTGTEIESLIDYWQIKRDRLQVSAKNQAAVNSKVTSPHLESNRVFIVHGQNEGAKYAVTNVLHQVGLEPIILHEMPNQGKTIIEKLEDHSNVAFAVVLLTPDDIGYPKDKPTELRPRARQNVILELGFFMAKLTRGRVCALHGEGVELPSDFQGIVYIPLDSHGAWKFKLGKELASAGFKIDLTNIRE